MIDGTLTDSTGTLSLPEFEVPFTETPIESAVDVTTLDNNLFTDFTENKRQWSIRYDSLTEDEFNELKAYYDRQFSLYRYPLLTVEYYTIEDVPVRMFMNPKNVYNNCGSVQDVEVTFRETAQLPEES